ncbi:MAG: hypothetical protein AAGA32_09635 [Pseudomonadota bacterium]
MTALVVSEIPKLDDEAQPAGQHPKVHRHRELSGLNVASMPLKRDIDNVPLGL